MGPNSTSLIEYLGSNDNQTSNICQHWVRMSYEYSRDQFYRELERCSRVTPVGRQVWTCKRIFFFVRGWVGRTCKGLVFECFPLVVETIRGLLIFCWVSFILIRVEEVLKTLIWVGEFSVWNKQAITGSMRDLRNLLIHCLFLWRTSRSTTKRSIKQKFSC